MKLAEIESLLGIEFPLRHKQAILDADDPIHRACDFLLDSSRYELLRLVDVNELLRRRDKSSAWPTFLVAFASNGCGDYFAYDLRYQTPKIIYMEPLRTIDENLASNDDALEFDTFEAWYEWKVEKYEG